MTSTESSPLPVRARRMNLYFSSWEHRWQVLFTPSRSRRHGRVAAPRVSVRCRRGERTQAPHKSKPRPTHCCQRCGRYDLRDMAELRAQSIFRNHPFDWQRIGSCGAQRRKWFAMVLYYFFSHCMIAELALSISFAACSAPQWLREPCLLLGNRRNECGLFHNQIDFKRFLVVWEVKKKKKKGEEEGVEMVKDFSIIYQTILEAF